MAASLSFFFYLSLPSLVLLPALASAVPAPEVGTIQRTTAQQILATLVPNSYQTPTDPIPILSSPSGDYLVYFLRRATIPGAGGFGGDFCYVQVRDTRTGQSVWESECTPMSTANTCSLVFSDAGLEVFDGSRSAWDTGVDVSVHLESLELVDEGDMRIRDQNGDLVWRASDDPRSNQECGSPGSPGMRSAQPPFAAPVDTSRNNNFGTSKAPGFVGSPLPERRPADLPLPQQEGENSKPVGFENPRRGFGQPLVDNTPYDSGNSMVVAGFCPLVLGFLLSMAGNGVLFPAEF